ncbi:Zinc metalloprotease ZmpB [Labeo rohita]|uniref:Zinc metalloprotease ZmpB n=1 Tax=Labeo rohita TaxID=84645 RepID=A0ABQ8L3T5_LABRO|nr:Zinc metalloprotease ZmpB [Labeo rohita]
MNDPAVLVLLLEQGDRSLEDHTRDYIFLAEHSHFTDSSLCKFYYSGLNTTTKALLSGEGPQESLPVYIEWVLASCGSSWTIDIIEEDVIPTPDPESSQPSPRFAEHKPEPTVDGEPEANMTDEPSPSGATELRIAQEPEPILSDQVREPADTSVTVECCVEQERAMESPAHCTAAEGEQGRDLGQLNLEVDLIFIEDIEMELPVCPELSTCLNFPPTLPLLSPSSPAASALPPLSPDSPSAHPQPTICAVGSPRVCQSPSASWLEDPSSSPPASESWTPPRPSDPPSGSPSVLCRSGSAADLWSSASASIARALGSALALRVLGVALDLWLSVSASGSTSTCSAAVGRPPGVVSPSSTMAPPSVGSTVG